jgi:hypothetical protein
MAKLLNVLLLCGALFVISPVHARPASDALAAPRANIAAFARTPSANAAPVNSATGHFASANRASNTLANAATPAGAAGDATADARLPMSWLPIEVRLRKLHLVRPDLIPYPIDFEVVC